MTGLPPSQALPSGPKWGADSRGWATATLLSIDTTAKRATVQINNGPAVALPYVDFGSYAGFTTVYVLLDPAGSGAGQLVLGPCGALAAPVQPPAPPPAAPTTQTVNTTIRPTWSGTWRNDRSLYDRWNVDRYGGRSTLWQGDSFGSGTLVGIAVYGNQLTALGADAITSAVLHVPLADSSGSVTVQGTPQGTSSPGVPTPSGASVSGAAGSTIALSSTMRENLRTGASKGLVLVGTDYLAIYGTARASGMALSITYTRST